MKGRALRKRAGDILWKVYGPQQLLNVAFGALWLAMVLARHAVAMNAMQERCAKLEESQQSEVARNDAAAVLKRAYQRRKVEEMLWK